MLSLRVLVQCRELSTYLNMSTTCLTLGCELDQQLLRFSTLAQGNVPEIPEVKVLLACESACHDHVSIPGPRPTPFNATCLPGGLL